MLYLRTQVEFFNNFLFFIKIRPSSWSYADFHGLSLHSDPPPNVISMTANPKIHFFIILKIWDVSILCRLSLFVFNSFLIFCKVDASLSVKRWFRGCFDTLNPPNRGIPNCVSYHNQTNDKFTAGSEAFDDFDSYRINTEINVKVYKSAAQ